MKNNKGVAFAFYYLVLSTALFLGITVFSIVEAGKKYSEVFDKKSDAILIACMAGVSMCFTGSLATTFYYMKKDSRSNTK